MGEAGLPDDAPPRLDITCVRRREAVAAAGEALDSMNWWVKADRVDIRYTDGVISSHRR